jgi:tRNA-2-methylthio-N6-dimethylallyladenosine synthase
MIAMFADIPKLANHFHLPAQHGSDNILNAMGRGYTADEYRKTIAEIRALRPTISISSDFIVGFPGETDEDFETLMQFIHDIKFDYSFSFIYSKRPGTPAAKLKDNVSLSTKKKRLKILQDTLKHYGHETSKNMVGTTQKILFTDVSKHDKNKIKGQTENNRYVHVEAPKSLIGNFADVIITEALPKSLRAELL